MNNIWKKVFFLLLGGNLLAVIFLLFILMIPAKEQRIPDTGEPSGKYVAFPLKTNKQDLDRVINYYVKKEAKDSPIDYQIKLSHDVELYGSIPLLSRELKMKLSFEPQALDNGDLMLRQKSVLIGSLHLPVPYVLKVISEHSKLPSGVVILPNDGIVYIDMKKINMKGHLKVKVNQFNLQKNDIRFTLLVPVK